MAAPMIVGSMVGGTALSMYGQSQSAKSQSAYYNYLAGTSTMNAGLTKAAGEANARAVGIEASDQMRRVTTGVRQTVGAQKAAIAGGVDFVRVHDVEELSRVVKVSDAIYR